MLGGVTCTAVSALHGCMALIKTHAFRGACLRQPALRQAFLDQRGEDYDDWFDKDALIVKAQECEVNTGPAGHPAPSQVHTQASQ